MLLDILLAGLTLILVVAAGVGLNRARGGLLERFTARRQLSWLVLGASMAASSTSADTPLLIAGAVYANGLAGNWFWWASAPGVLATLFFFAQLWRRAGVVTEVEIIALRYGQDATTRRYRMFVAAFDGVIVNALVLGSNVFAFGLVLSALLDRLGAANRSGLADAIVLVCLLATACYALLVGFRGLVKSDAAEFAVSIAVCIVLAVVAVAKLPHGLSSLGPLLSARSRDPLFALWPNEDMLAPLVLLICSWWHSAPGKGMLAQRIVASRDERSAMLTVFTFTGLHYLVRPWAWYIVGATGLIYLPHLANPEAVFPKMAAQLLPSGLFGLLVMAIALSFMASVNSRLNFGASLIVNDVAMVLRPTISPQAQKRLEAGVILLLCIMSFAVGTLWAWPGIRTLYQFLTMMLAGTGFVAIARWYWWRTTIWSEICSLVSAILVAAISLSLADISDPLDYAMTLGFNFIFGTVVTLLAAFFGPPANREVAAAFYTRVLPGGPGWGGFAGGATSNLGSLTIQWLLANGALFIGIFAVSRALGGDVPQTVGYATVSTVCFVALYLAWRPLRSAPTARIVEKPRNGQ
ncbi:MAG: hypothetical protein B7Y43_03895 [Sphingomonas sp. 28-62-20]|uniref:sodium:solute symporter family transporter n=1 Tax=Sphingomonas sp. 28-62-20 TaxID=1970433 RepID=UPI000BCB6FE1|nr:MAG: hypothetical protein B7Y43_03895 [Sphingomonas sp. 28-62-20]